MTRRIAALLLLVAGTMPAAAATIDFEELSVGTTGPISSQGFEFSHAFLPHFDAGVIADINGTNVLSVSYESCAVVQCVDFITMQSSDGSLFAFYSAELTDDFDGLILGGTIRGITADGTTAFSEFDQPLGTGDWLNVSAVQFIFGVNTGVPGLPSGGAAMVVDNIVVGAAVVPLPAAAWLFGSALGLLGWMRRRHSA